MQLEGSIDREPLFADPAAVGRLLDEEMGADQLWLPQERTEILEGEMAAPVSILAQVLGTATSLKVAQACEAASPPIRRLRELFSHASPPLDVLLIVAKTAHHELTAVQPLLERNVATVIYHLAMGTARAHYGKDLQRQAAPIDVLDGLERLSHASWIDEETVALLSNCAQRLRSQRASDMQGK